MTHAQACPSCEDPLYWFSTILVETMLRINGKAEIYCDELPKVNLIEQSIPVEKKAANIIRKLSN